MFKRVFSKQNRILVGELVRTDFKLRYQGSVLGYAWSLLRPLLLFLILYVVFVKFLKLGNGVPHYPVYLLFGMVLWNFFTEITTLSVGSIVGRGELLKKIRIPRWTIVISTSLASLINLGLNLIVVIIFMIISGVGFRATDVFFLGVLIELYLLALGVSFFLSAAFVKYRDISYIWEVFLQGFFYLTPILYPLSRIPSVTLQKILALNPLAQILQNGRYDVVTHQTITTSKLFDGGWYVLIPYGIVFAILISSAFYFKKKSKYFAENI